MAGNVQAGRKTRDILKARNPNYYRDLGAIGGKYTGPKGFASMDKDKALEASRKGGASSRRGKAKKTN